ncbi:MAG: hypothetical protein LBS96_05680 [Oscillospiraceae bacterium]|jgi:hypothetical protein|nr:hypothetical protein [Oscillospiraceae bacterium]
MKIKSIRRAFCVALAVVLLCGTLQGFAAADASDHCEHNPVILISGFGAVRLVDDDGYAFLPAGDAVTGFLQDNSGDLLKGIATAAGLPLGGDLLAMLVKLVEDLVEPLAMHPDGTPVHPEIHPVVSGAANTSLAAFRAAGLESEIPYASSQFLDMQLLADQIGADHVFNFMFDYRKSSLDLAEEFRTYVADVLRLTGHDRVNVYAISQGAMLVGAYLYAYGGGQIGDVVFDTPMLQGSDLITDFITDPLQLNFPLILRIASAIAHTELKLERIGGVLPADTLNPFLSSGAAALVLPRIIYAPALWDSLPAQRQAEKQALWLSDPACAPLKAKIQQMQEGFLTHVTETFEKATADGATISIVACAGLPLATGTVDNSDGIVNLRYACGATSAALGETFPADYVQQRDIGHYAISPDRTIDLSTGYWPQRTWIINRHIHGQVEWNPRSLALIMKLLTDAQIPDAWSSWEYPQFMECDSPTAELSARFTCTNSAFLPVVGSALAGTSLVIQNPSREVFVTVQSVRFTGGTLRADSPLPFVLAPGQSVSLAIQGDAPTSAVFDTLEVSYRRLLRLSPVETLQIGITITPDSPGAVQEEPPRRESACAAFFHYLWALALGTWRLIS